MTAIKAPSRATPLTQRLRNLRPVGRHDAMVPRLSPFACDTADAAEVIAERSVRRHPASTPRLGGR